tara:strand:+ start:634 stop:927 length:294 start_codon:yes stop_codon:yes gene_type:complete
MTDDINHPAHYNKGIESTKYISSWAMSFVEGNIVKYVTRYKMKGGVTDLKKAAWYLNYLIENYETTRETLRISLDDIHAWASSDRRTPGSRENDENP